MRKFSTPARRQAGRPFRKVSAGLDVTLLRPEAGGEDELARLGPRLLPPSPLQFHEHLLSLGVQVHGPRPSVLRVQEEDANPRPAGPRSTSAT
jgi:hypothetical protein